MLLTTRHPFRVGTGPEVGGELEKAEITIAEAFKANGYATGIFGKWHNGADPDTPEYRRAFTEAWKSMPNKKLAGGLGVNEHGFDEAWVNYGGGAAVHAAEAADATLETDKGQTWRQDLLPTVRHGGYEPFFQKLLDWRGGLRGQKRKAADKLIGYVASRAEMILYQQCDQRGWNVGSRPMESMCGVTTDRLKGRGRRWDLDNAEAMMALEALYQSTGLWDKYWCQALHHLN